MQLQDDTRPRNNGRIIWLVAASITALIAIVFFYRSDALVPGLAKNKAEQKETQNAFTFLSEEMQEAQSFYANQVEDRMHRLSKYPVDADLKEEMDLLTGEFEILKSEMGQGLDDNKVVEAMIDNYRLRLDLLEDLLQALDTDSESKKQKFREEHEI